MSYVKLFVRHYTRYLTDVGIPESVSFDLIGKVAGRIEHMGIVMLPIRKTKKERAVKT
jgi:hypothetical protein